MGSRIGLAVAALVCAASAVACSGSHKSAARPSPSVSASPSAPSPSATTYAPGHIPTPSFTGMDPGEAAIGKALVGACNSAPQVCASFMADNSPSPSR